ncbi:MAG TPA: site-2 protease family protein [Thermoanaerobaculia bacterium]
MSEPPHEGPPLPFPRRPLIELLPAAGEPPPRQRVRPRYGLALLLFALTLFCTTTLGPVMVLYSRSDVQTGLLLFLTPQTVSAVWRDRELLAIGLSFSIPALIILLAHEMGHYVACRLYGLPCTLPYFLPVPLNFGTFGAFIKIKAPIRTKRELFDVGVAGPIAGFVALLPFLLYGIARSEPAAIASDAASELLVLAPGKCLAIQLVTLLFHGRLGEGMYLNLHPVALAAWLGLLATSLNLLPLGQLDGGHILYAAVGRLQRRLALPLWVGLGLIGLYWPGWFLWCAIVLLIGLYHPPVWDEHTPLDPTRRKIAWLALLLFLLSFMPIPLEEIPVG